jgi:hypothetical protein
MRVIIRFSLNADRGSVLRNTLRGILEAQGILWTGRTTGTYEGNVSEQAIRRALSRFWRTVTQNQTGALIDHFWMYADRQPRPRGLDDR